MKRCTKCGVEKEESEFYKDARKASGLYSHCKMCFGAHNAERRRINREKILAKEAEYREVNREAIRIRNAAWRLANPDRHKEQMRRGAKNWVTRNPEKAVRTEVRSRMKRALSAPPPEELVEAKTLFILINRQIKEMTK